MGDAPSYYNQIPNKISGIIPFTLYIPLAGNFSHSQA
jgi:hypothetical protein